jgi:hypothetical protein
VTTNRQGHYMVVWEYAYVGPCCDWDIRYLFAYEGDSQGDPTQFRHIYGRQWTPNEVFLPAVLRSLP